MADASVYLRKRKDKIRVPSSRPAGSALASHAPSGTSSPLPPAGLSAAPSPSASVAPKTEPKSEPPDSANPNLTFYRIVSSGRPGTRYNLMKLNTAREFDPASIPPPVLLNRKRPGGRQMPVFARDATGRIIGRYVYDAEGRPVLGADGQPAVQSQLGEQRDMALVGGAQDAEGQNRPRRRRGVKEVYVQDKEVMRLRREERDPWVLESGRPAMPGSQDGAAASGSASGSGQGKNHDGDQWVGQLQEPGSMPVVLLINDGQGGTDFKMIPLGRTYRFDPERPFKVLDPDAAHKLYEHQTKFKLYDRWAQREGGPALSASGAEAGGSRSAAEGRHQIEQEQRAARMEQRMLAARGEQKPQVKRERYDEGSGRRRGLEGGVDEELDYDFEQEFQDDEETNLPYRNEEEEEEAKELQEALKREFRLANANVGDRPQISDAEDEEDLFGDKELDSEGKRLRRFRKKHGEEDEDDLFGASDSEDDGSENESVASGKTNKSARSTATAPGSSRHEEKDRSKDKDKEREHDRARSSSRADRDRERERERDRSRGTSTPSTPHGPPGSSRPFKKGGKATTAPLPLSGSALLAHRATTNSRGTSPLPSRAGSPSAPSGGGGVGGGGRASSPPTRGGTPSASASARGSSPAAPSSREGSPALSVNGGGGKRKTVPGPAEDGGDAGAKRSKPAQSTHAGSGKTAQAPQLAAAPASAGLPARPAGGAGPASSGAGSASGTAKPPAPGSGSKGKGKSKSKSLTPTPSPAPARARPPEFPGHITRQEVVDWFRGRMAADASVRTEGVSMKEVVGAFRPRLKERGDEQSRWLLFWAGEVAEKGGRGLVLKSGV